jgi:uncharacterized heparinase superfamily protein
LNELALYFHTVRHLRPIQVFARLRRRLYQPRPNLRPAPARRPQLAPYCEPIAPAPSLSAPDTFHLLNVERRCTSDADWHPADASALWVYHLHYFDDLNAQGAAARESWHRALLVRWVRENPPARGAAWDPYPVSRRLGNWIKWALRGHVLPPECQASLAVQSRWLVGHLEHHLLGNHLFANAVALVHAGLFFSGHEAEAWYARGMGILRRELKEQLLGDGGHFELSPMYHALLLTDLLDLVNLHQAYGVALPAGWPHTIVRMQTWLEALSHPDGEIAFFNDATGGAAPRAAETAAYAARLALPRAAHPPTEPCAVEYSGYVRAQAGPALLLCDCAAVGPDYLPAHAHADSLSFELSLHGQRLLVNSGISQYGVDHERLRQRGTAAHNTVLLDGQNSSEVWGGFRTARRARVLRRKLQTTHDTLSVEAAHDGYRRLSGRNEHLRRWRLTDHSLHVLDHISGPFRLAQAFFHLHPEVQLQRLDSSVVQLQSPQLPGTVRMHCEPAEELEVRASSWYPGFGRERESHCIVVRFKTSGLLTRFEWR